MTRPERASKTSFAYVYDALYGADTLFLRAQLDFLRSVFGPPSGPLLDVGCGTGTHVAGLSQLGYSVVGMDVDPLMLGQARRKLPRSGLALADMRRIPAGGAAFAAALCLESPLACLMTAVDLRAALASIRDKLRDGGQLVIDVYDYPGTLGSRPSGSHRAYFQTQDMRVTVTESHHYEKQRRLWTMRQQFEVEEDGGARAFEVLHRLRVRTMDEYAAALEASGFTVLQALTAYPGVPEPLRHERRIILVVRR